MAFEAPRVAELLNTLPREQWLATIEDLLEYGTAALMWVKISASVQLLERQMEGLTDQLQVSTSENLGKTLESDRTMSKEMLMRLLNEHATSINKLLVRYVDPNSRDGLPALATERLEEVNRTALRQLDALPQDGDEGAHGKLAARLTEQMADIERNICNQVAARNAFLTKSVHKGRPFEEAISLELAELVLPYGGQVERVGDSLDVKRQKHGDNVITFNGPLARAHTIRIALEAKTAGAQTFSLAAVRAACQNAREKREADACIFVGETTDVLPDGRAFGPVGNRDYLVAWSPDGRNELLGITLYIALADAMQALAAEGNADLDRSALRMEIDASRHPRAAERRRGLSWLCREVDREGAALALRSPFEHPKCPHEARQPHEGLGGRTAESATLAPPSTALGGPSG